MTWATQFSTMGGPVGDPWTWAYRLSTVVLGIGLKNKIDSRFTLSIN